MPDNVNTETPTIGVPALDWWFEKLYTKLCKQEEQLDALADRLTKNESETKWLRRGLYILGGLIVTSIVEPLLAL